MKKKKYGYDFSEKKDDWDEEEDENYSFVNSISKSKEIEESVFVQFLLNRIIKKGK